MHESEVCSFCEQRPAVAGLAKQVVLSPTDNSPKFIPCCAECHSIQERADRASIRGAIIGACIGAALVVSALIWMIVGGSSGPDPEFRFVMLFSLGLLLIMILGVVGLFTGQHLTFARAPERVKPISSIIAQLKKELPQPILPSESIGGPQSKLDRGTFYFGLALILFLALAGCFAIFALIIVASTLSGNREPTLFSRICLIHLLLVTTGVHFYFWFTRQMSVLGRQIDPRFINSPSHGMYLYIPMALALGGLAAEAGIIGFLCYCVLFIAIHFLPPRK